MHEFDDETLMAFADGQLDEPTFSEVAAAVEAEPALAERLELLVLGKDLTKAVYAPLADLAVPRELTDAVRSAAGGEAPAATVVPFRQRNVARLSLAGLAVAACLGALVAGPAGYLLSQAQDGGGLRVGGPLRGELAALVGSVPSGQEQRLDDGTLLRPIATFADAAGTLCREFEVDGASTTVAVACRAETEWRVAFALNTPVAADGYTPAAALEMLDIYLQSILAGDPLSLDAEAAALAE